MRPPFVQVRAVGTGKRGLTTPVRRAGPSRSGAGPAPPGRWAAPGPVTQRVAPTGGGAGGGAGRGAGGGAGRGAGGGAGGGPRRAGGRARRRSGGGPRG